MYKPVGYACVYRYPNTHMYRHTIDAYVTLNPYIKDFFFFYREIALHNCGSFLS